GPLQLDFRRRVDGSLRPKIENAAVTGANPATLDRLKLWMQAGIVVEDRPDWVFIKLHCHGMDPRDESTIIGEAQQKFLTELIGWARDNTKYRLHFVTGREMVNIALAATDGKEGNPSEYRDFRFRPQRPRQQP